MHCFLEKSLTVKWVGVLADYLFSLEYLKKSLLKDWWFLYWKLPIFDVLY